MNRKLRILHRYLGIFAAVFIAILTVSGLLLNHTEALQLDEKRISNPWLLKWYGIEATPITSFQAGQNIISFDGINIYRNTQIIATCDNMVGALTHSPLLIIACEKQLMLFTEEGQLVESMDHLLGLPTPIQALGLDGQQQVFLRVDQQTLKVDMENMQFQAYQPEAPTPIKSITSPPQIQKHIQQQSQAHGLHMERLLQDIHSGRILGFFGVLLMDFAALVLVFMAFSGLWVWLKKR